jgi:hypothetical protein
MISKCAVSLRRNDDQDFFHTRQGTMLYCDCRIGFEVAVSTTRSRLGYSDVYV